MTTKPAKLSSEGHAGGMVPSHLIGPEAFTSDDHTELISHAYTTDDESILTGCLGMRAVQARDRCLSRP